MLRASWDRKADLECAGCQLVGEWVGVSLQNHVRAINKMVCNICMRHGKEESHGLGMESPRRSACLARKRPRVRSQHWGGRRKRVKGYRDSSRLLTKLGQYSALVLYMSVLQSKAPQLPQTLGIGEKSVNRGRGRVGGTLAELEAHSDSVLRGGASEPDSTKAL